MNNTSLGPNAQLWQWRCRPQLIAMLTSTSTPTKQFLFRWGQNKQICEKKYLMGGTSALVLNSVNCRALSVLPLVWMSQKNLCLQHFFLKGWDEAREIHAYPPGENNSTSFWIIFMMTVLMRILFTIITIHIMVKTFCLSVGEERSLQKVRILRICRLCRPKSCEVDFSFIHLLCIWNSCWNIAQTFK